jgi:hypothetical protein
MVTVDDCRMACARHSIGSPVVVVVTMVDAAANVVELGMVGVVVVEVEWRSLPPTRCWCAGMTRAGHLDLPPGT